MNLFIRLLVVITIHGNGAYPYIFILVVRAPQGGYWLYLILSLTPIHGRLVVAAIWFSVTAQHVRLIAHIGRQQPTTPGALTMIS